MGAILENPLVEIRIAFAKGADGEPDISKPEHYAVLYSKFGDRGPMTLNPNTSSDNSITLTGELAPGGHVKGRLHGTDRFGLSDDVRNYEWDITVDLPVK